MIYLPLEHIEQRYTTHLDRDILDYLTRNKIEFKYMSPETLGHTIVNGSFLDAGNTVYRQFYQFSELIEGLYSGEIATDETLFVTDIWNFALMAIPYLNFFCNYNLKVQGVLHAGSFTDTDFVRKMERVYKGFEESIFDICEKIYVGSEFIRQDLLSKRFVSPGKVIAAPGIPLDFDGLKPYLSQEKKEDLIVFNGRNVDEKQPYLFELLRKKLPEYGYINTQQEGLSKNDYYKVLSKAKVVVSFALQENFGIGVQEATYLGCIPIVPNRLAYVEQFPAEYRYNTFEECVEKVKAAMEGRIKPTRPVFENNDEVFDIWFKDFKKNV